jgi:hypothetical protein
MVMCIRTVPWNARCGLCAATALMVGLSACGGNTTQPAPTPIPQTLSSSTPASTTPAQSPAGQPLTATGTVIDFTNARRPVPNLRLKVTRGSRVDGAVGGTPLPDVLTDENGRYVIDGLPRGIYFFHAAPEAGHKFLCPFYPLFVGGPIIPPPGAGLYDLPVVHATWSGNTVPPGMWLPGTSMYGTVSEHVGERIQPVAAATVALDGGVQDPPSTTNDAGFYMICSVVGTDQSRTIAAQKGGYRAMTRQVFGGWDFLVDFELVRD